MGWDGLGFFDRSIDRGLFGYLSVVCFLCFSFAFLLLFLRLLVDHAGCCFTLSCPVGESKRKRSG